MKTIFFLKAIAFGGIIAWNANGIAQNLPADAKSSPSKISILIYQKNHLGFKSSDKIEKLQNSISVNGLSIPASSYEKAFEIFQKLERLEETSKIQCDAGIYVHTVIQDKQKKFVTNCLNSSHFAELSKSLSRLKELVKK